MKLDSMHIFMIKEKISSSGIPSSGIKKGVIRSELCRPGDDIPHCNCKKLIVKRLGLLPGQFINTDAVL